MLSGKLESALWFLKRPQLFPQFVHLVGKKLFSRPEADTRAESERWCEGRAIEADAALKRLTGHGLPRSVADQYASVFAAAHARVQACPVKMGGPGALDLIYGLALRAAGGRPARGAIETGVAYGWSSLAIRLAQQGGRLVSTDMPYIRGNNDDYVGLVVPEDLRAGWRLARLSDRQALPGALRELAGTLDFCHYDSDKTYAGRMWAYPKLWNALSSGGFLVSDDIGDNVGFRDFAAAIGVEPVIVRFADAEQAKYVGVLVKPA